MAHEKITIRDFVKEISKGNYVIPHFQRDFDWKPNMAADLFESIIHKYYAGTILLWLLGENEKNLKMWDPLWGSKKAAVPTTAILDGQQRLSSIFYVVSNPQKKFPNRASYYQFFIDLDNLLLGNEDESIVYTYTQEYKSVDFIFKKGTEYIKNGRFPLCFLSKENYLDSEDFERLISKYLESRENKEEFRSVTSFGIARKINGILDYSFLTETLEKQELKEICQIFANINSKGLKLDIFDLMNAFLYPKGIQLRKNWENLDNPALKEVDSEMKTYLLKQISLDLQKYCSSRFLYNLIPGSVVKDREGNKKVLVKDKIDFSKRWTSAIWYAEKARKKVMNCGNTDFGAIKSKFIPNTTIIPVIGALMHTYDSRYKKTLSEQDFNSKINRWYWCSVISGDYSGSSDSVMAKDFKEVSDWFDDNKKIPERVDKINSLMMEESIDLYKIQNTNSAQYSAVLNILALRSARDFYTGRILGNYPVDQIHDHHIFPQKCGLKISEMEIDSILNRTLIVDDTNNKIKEKTPKEYYKLIIKKLGSEKEVEKIMESHLISSKAIEFMKNNDFKGFIRERNRTIKDEFKRRLGIVGNKSDDSLIEPSKIYDNKIRYISYIEGCNKFIWLIDPYFNENTLRLLNTGIQNNRSVKSIRILTRSNHMSENFKNLFKDFRRQIQNDGMDIELRVLLDSKAKAELHDRYLITKGNSYNFVSADTVSRGQLSNVTEVSNMKPFFNKYWFLGKDLILRWDEISEDQKKSVKRNL